MVEAHAVSEREYPAYGRSIAKTVNRGLRPIACAVLLSSRWYYFDHVPKVCIRPDEWRRSKFEFRYLAGLHLVAIPGDDCTEHQLGELLVDLMMVGPTAIWAYNVDGSKLSEEDWPSSIAHWVRDLRGAEIFELAKNAAARMQAAQRRALEQYTIEHERIAKRSEDDALRFMLQEYEVKDRIRALFAAPARAPGARAA
jgi:hypothetical protein